VRALRVSPAPAALRPFMPALEIFHALEHFQTISPSRLWPLALLFNLAPSPPIF
jgi:hypothetical protein